MTPGIAFFYGGKYALLLFLIPEPHEFLTNSGHLGLLRRKNTLSMLYLGMMTMAVASFQWFFWGYSLAFSDTGSSKFIGDLRAFSYLSCYSRPRLISISSRVAEYLGLKGVLEKPSMGSTRIPALVFSIYQSMFAAITYVVRVFQFHLLAKKNAKRRPMIAVGAFAERAHLGPIMVFVFVWCTLVYDPIAYWTWNANGWSFLMGGLDFAGESIFSPPEAPSTERYPGGSPVHISSGTAALAISIYLKKRRGYGTERLAYKPNNTSYVILGTIFLWFGWFGKLASSLLWC